MVSVRFAPSPTGYLHLGNARTAILNWLFARHCDGRFIFRLDDTDAKRNKEEYVQGIKDDLCWLGLNWDDTFCQSSRMQIYEKYIEVLKKQGRLYPCYESAEELEEKRNINRKKGLPPIYDRASLINPKSDHRSAHWRFFLEPVKIEWEDIIQGKISYNSSHLSDPILVREDQSISYLLSSVIDDYEYQISHIIRGADHITNTAIQIQLFEAIGASIPNFAHFPLMFDALGEKFSKRNGSLTLSELKQQRILPLAIFQTLASIGSSVDYSDSVDQIIKSFSLHSYGKASPKFDIQKINMKNQTILRNLSYEEVSKLQSHMCSIELWEIIKENIETLAELDIWTAVCDGDLEKSEVSIANFFDANLVLSHLPPAPWDKTSWDNWITAIVAVYPNYKKSFISLQMRKILTGKDKGPKMSCLFPMINQSCVYKRLT